MKMKTIARALLCVTVVGLCYAPSRASDFSLFGSYWNTKDLDAGVGGGLKWSPSFGDSSWAFELRGSYFDDVKVDTGDTFDFQVRAIPVELGVKYDFRKNENVNVYLGAGIGYYFLDTNLGELDDEVGYYGVVGMQFGQSKGASFFIEGLYRKLEGTVDGVSEPGDPTVSQDVDIDLSGAAANMGVSWRW